MEESLDVPFRSAGVAGLGLIGGSLALALRQAGLFVKGFDVDGETVRTANAAGIAASIDPSPLNEVEVLFVALYPDDAIKFVRTHAAHFKKGCLVVDCCGIKSRVVRTLAPVAKTHGFTFIGGHPMAGKEIGGFSAAEAGLFQGASFLLVPPAPDTPLLAPLEALLRRIGCVPKVTTAAHHDRMIAFTSQLPHALACAYVLSSSCPGHAGFSAGSYRDVSRVAHINPALWTELFLENRDAFCEELDEMITHLWLIQYATKRRNRKLLQFLLQKARESKDMDENPDAPQKRLAEIERGGKTFNSVLHDIIQNESPDLSRVILRAIRARKSKKQCRFRPTTSLVFHPHKEKHLKGRVAGNGRNHPGAHRAGV